MIIFLYHFRENHKFLMPLRKPPSKKYLINKNKKGIRLS